MKTFVAKFEKFQVTLLEGRADRGGQRGQQLRAAREDTSRAPGADLPDRVEPRENFKRND